MKNIFQFSAEEPFTKFLWETIESEEKKIVEENKEAEQAKETVINELETLIGDVKTKEIERASANELIELRNEVEGIREALSVNNKILSPSEKSNLSSQVDAISVNIDEREKVFFKGKTKEDAQASLQITRKKVEDMDLSTLDLTDPSDLQHTLNNIEQKVSIAIYNAEDFPEFSNEIREITALFKEKRIAIEKAAVAVHTFTDQIKEKTEEQQQQRETLEQEMKSKMQATLDAMAKTPEELQVNELPEFNEENLESFQGVSEEYMKHQMHSNILNKEIAVMTDGVAEFDQKFQTLEASKHKLDANTFYAGVLVVGAYAAGTALAMGLTAVSGGTLSFLAPAIIGATGYVASKSATALGFGESPEYEELRKRQQTLKKAFKEKSPKIAQKQEELETRSEKIKGAVSTEGSLSKSATDMRQKFLDIETRLREEGLPEPLILEVIEKLEESVKQGVDVPLETLKSGVEDPASGIEIVTKANQNSVVNLATNNEYIEQDLNIVPPTILDKTLGTVGEGVSWVGDKLEKVDHPLIKVIGGAIDGAGELVSGVGALVDNPQNLIAIAGFDPSGQESWPQGWSNLLDGITAKEERLEDNNWAAGGKIAFNVVSMVFGGPKRGLSKLKAFRKGAAKTTFGKAAGAGFKEVIAKPGRFLKKINPFNGAKLSLAEKLTEKLSKAKVKLGNLQSKGPIRRFFNKGKRTRLAAKIEELTKMKKAAIKEAKASAKVTSSSSKAKVAPTEIPNQGARANVRLSAAEKLFEKASKKHAKLSKSMIKEAQEMFPNEKGFNPKMTKKQYVDLLNKQVKTIQKQARIEWGVDVPVVALAMQDSSEITSFVDTIDSDERQYTEKELQDARRFLKRK